MRFTDLSGDSASETRATQLATDEACQPFDLEQAPLLRSHLLRIDREEHLLVLTFHHFVFDAWSQGVLLDELSQNYESLSKGLAPPNRSLNIHYADFAAWDRSPSRVASLDKGRSYWRRELENPPVLQLPTDFTRSTTPAEGAGHVDITLPEKLIGCLRQLAAREQSTFFSILLTTFTALLHRYAGQDDIVVGCPVASRNRLETEPLIGVFINTLPFRTRLASADTFRQVLKRVSASVIRGLQYHEVPLQFIVQDTVTDRDLSGSPLFRAMFIHERFAIHSRTAASVVFEPQDTPPAATMVDMTLELMESPTQVSGRFVYRSELLEHATVERMVGHFLTLLQGIVTDADQRLSELPLLTEAERHQLLVEWNDTATDFPSNKCVHQLFEEQVQRTPDAVAVVFEEQQLSYRELNERANQLAHYLQSLGVEPETLVGLCLDRSPELVVGILGILKAGGAYVPLDADYPQQRLQFMLADARIEVLVTQESLRDHLPAADWRIVCLDTEAAKLQDMAPSNPLVNVSTDSLAYIMFTSGSTGKPKGVLVTHGSIVRLVFDNDYAVFGPDRVFLQLAPASFDASTFELWGALLHGAKLVLAPTGLPDFQQLEAILKRYQVTTLWLTATLFSQIVEHCPQTLCNVEEILTGGEALSVRHIVQAQASLGSGVQLINGYGPTESTTFTSCYRIPSHIGAELTSISIGRPIANTQAYVLDQQRQPVPIGVSGELYIGGAGLARGYLNRPELTAEKFVSNPFSDDVHSRLYRTGDLCHWRADGNLEFLGRIDDQVKLRGFRIELGEIEATLNEHPSVAHSVLMLREDRPGDKRLVAYCVASSDNELNFSELRSYLQNQLPSYMLPAAVVRLESLPLTSSGKIDRRALPASDDSRPEMGTSYVAPRNPLEEQLADIWCEVLQLDRVGVHDNFFALGGHSLLVARMVELVNRHFRRRLSIALVFRNPTIAEVAGCLESSEPKEPTALTREDRFLQILRQGEGSATLVCLGVPTGQLMVRLPQHVGVLQLNTEPHLRWGIEQFADAFALKVEQAVPSGPIIIVGYSYGGLIASALSNRLRERVGQPVELIMIEPSIPAWKCDLFHTRAEAPAQRLDRHFGNLRAAGIKGSLPYITTKLSFIIRRRLWVPWERWQIGWKIKLNLPLKTGQKWKYDAPTYHRNILEYTNENVLGDACLLGGAEYLQKHEDFWRTAVAGECRMRLLHNNSAHLDILDAAKSDEWISFLAELACSTNQ